MNTSKMATDSASKKRVWKAYNAFQKTLEKLDQKYPREYSQNDKAGGRLTKALSEMAYAATRATFYQVVIEELGKDVWLLWKTKDSHLILEGKKPRSELCIDVEPTRDEPFDGEPISNWSD